METCMRSGRHAMTSGPDILCRADVGHAGQKMREMTVELARSRTKTWPAVADFLHANHNDRVPWLHHARRCHGRWEAPNHGFMLRDGSVSSAHYWLSTPSG